MLPDESNSHDELKADIEVKKLLLEVQHGANFYEVGKDIPPEIEKQWLDNIMQFEQLHKNAEMVSLYDFVGKPAFKKIDELLTSEIDFELDRITSLLNKKGVWLDVLADYENKSSLIYKFITEEFLLHEVENIDLSGWNQHFIYEEFHPNHVYDISKNTDELIRYLFNEKHPGEKRFDEFLFDVGDFIEVEVVDRDYKQKISPALTHFFNSLPQRNLIEFNITRLEYNLLDNEDDSKRGTATANVCIQFSAFTETREQMNFTGTGTILLELQWDYWQIVKVQLPGLTLG